MRQSRSFDNQLIQIFNRYLEPGGEEAWVKTLENSLSLPTCYFESADWIGPNAPPIWSQALRMIYNPPSLRKIRTLHRDLNAKAWLIHNVFPTGSVAIYREAQKNRIPVIQYIHNFRPVAISGYLLPSDLPNFPNRIRTYSTEIRGGYWQNSRSKTAWLAAVLSLARLLGWFNAITVWIAVSDFMRDQFIRAGVPADKIFTLRHFWRPTDDIDPGADDGHYLFMGRLAEMKGILVLLDAWDLIWKDKKNNAPKLIVCGDGPLKEDVRARALANPLITFKGVISGNAKHDLLRGARAVIAPSVCLESLGLVAYEAYDFAKPVLASRAGGLAEVVTHGSTGFIHEPGDVRQLANDVLKLEENREARIEMGKKGREWLLANANEHEWKKRFSAIIDFAISQHRP